MSLPLDKQNVTYLCDASKAERKLPALHPKWVEKREFVSYQAPPTDLTDRGQYEEWVERIRFIEEDLHWLLQLPHDKFWCQAVFDETLNKLIDSYLRYAPRSYNVIHKLPEESKEIHDEIHRLVFMSCLRMATHKESKEFYITPSVFGEILYENFIFDIPKLFDLCVLYGQGNSKLLTKMLENIFTQQPKYNDDLAQTIDTMSQVFDAVLVKCGIKVGSKTPAKLTGNNNGKDPALVAMEFREFEDLILYLSDIGVTLTSFLQVHSAACIVFHDSEFIHQLPSFYDTVIPAVFSALKQRDLDPSEKTFLKSKITEAKKQLLSVFQTIMNHCCIQPILEKSGNTVDHVEGYLQIMSSVLGDRRFLADYESLFSIHEDLDILAQAMPEIDETRLQYIHDAVNTAYSTFGKRKSPKGAMNRGGRRSPDGSPGPLEEGAIGGVKPAKSQADGDTSSPQMPSMSDAYQVEELDVAGASAMRITGIELESLITSVKDLLPYLGEGFIELCLEEFDYEIEKVINAVLEDKLPPSLQDIDRQMDRERPPEPPRTVLTERRNIYDFDEFDVFNRSDIDTSKVKIGKGDKTDDVKIGDSSLKAMHSDIVKDYGVVIDTITVEPGDPTYSRDEYDDEYDDTYDTNVVGADDMDDADELTNIRPFSTPRILQDHSRRKEEVYYGGDSEDDEDEDRKKRDHFIEDPAVLRQRAAERAQLKANRQQNKGPVQGPRKYDVKGGPKGQGQTEEVVRNRQFKTQHKGGNRRALADKKRKV